MLENARYLRDGLEARGFAVVAPQPLPEGGDVVTPIVPVLVGDDWKAVFLWRALYDAGVFVNTALHPAVPPGGALLRTSVMATHDRATLDRALAAFASVKDASRPSTGPAGPRRALSAASSRGSVRRACEAARRPAACGRARLILAPAACPFLHKSRQERKKAL